MLLLPDVSPQKSADICTFKPVLQLKIGAASEKRLGGKLNIHHAFLMVRIE
jgi:hypothetical protein